MTEGITGILVPVVTPLEQSGSPDISSLCRHVEWLLAHGVHGIWVNGTSGEFASFTSEERTLSVKAAVEQVRGRVPVIAHVGDAFTRQTAEHARAAREVGADFIAVIAPFYAPYSEKELVSHYAAVAEVSGGPILIYQHPWTGQPPLQAETIVKLVAAGIVSGIKESSGDLEYFRSLLEAARNAGVLLRSFHGSAASAMASLMMGSSGLISVLANLVPGTCVELFEAVGAGEKVRAEELQSRLTALNDGINAVFVERGRSVAVVAACKWILREKGNT